MVVGLAGMGDLKKVGRVGAVAVIYFELVTTLALVIGLIVANVATPGAGFHADASKLDAGSLARYTSASS